MTMRTFFAVLTTSLLLLFSASAQTFTDPQFVSELAVGGLAVPLGVVWAPDGRMFIWEKAGRVRIVKNGQLLPTPFVDIRDHVNTNTDRGLAGLALDPNFSTNGFVYLAYVFENLGNTQSADPRTQRVTRVQADPANPDVALPGETVLIGSVTDPNCAWASDCSPNNKDTHTIDSLAFGPDGLLYVSIGDGAAPSFADANRLRAQSLDSLNGKMLRIKTDGTAPPDNPFFDGNPNSNKSKIYDYGLRNPFRFTFDSRNGQLYIGDVGSFYFEEIDRGRGVNFGWPCFEGLSKNPDEATRLPLCTTMTGADVVDPVFAYPRAANGAAIMLGPVYNAATYPDQYRGNIFFADFIAKDIRRIPIAADGTLGAVQEFATAVTTDPLDGPVYFTVGPDGNIYYVLLTIGQVRRIRFTGTNNKSPIPKLSATPTSGLSPLDVQFSSAGSSDPEGGALTFAWDFGDGTTSAEPNPAHRYTVQGVKNFVARLTVTDPQGASASDTVTITVGSRPPTATIESPGVGTVSAVGTVIAFQGSATDPDDGPLPPASLAWNIILLHNDHAHPVSTTTGAGGSFTIENHGEHGDKIGYLIRLTATDQSGLTDVKEVIVEVQGDSFVISSANGTPMAATVQAGQSASYALHVFGPQSFNGPIDLTCSGAPANSTCRIDPARVTLTAGAPQTFTVTITTNAGTTASLHSPLAPGIFTSLLGAVAMLWIPIRKRAGSRRRLWSWWLFGVLTLLLLSFIACGGGGGSGTQQSGATSSRTPAGNYTVQINGSTGQTSTSANLKLTVQ